VLAGGITLTAVSVANATAEEPARQCAVALKDIVRAAKASTASLAKVDETLEQITSVILPGEEAWTSTEYSARAGVDAVEAVEARASGAEHVASVTDARKALAKIKLPTDWVEREEAVAITALTAEAKTATVTLEASLTALLADFAAFQGEETARIAAEIEAARIAAEIEAARIAAEAAAAAEAERQRAAASKGGTGGGSGGPPGRGGIEPCGQQRRLLGQQWHWWTCAGSLLSHSVAAHRNRPEPVVQ
jgi:hypothetical protein